MTDLSNQSVPTGTSNQVSVGDIVRRDNQEMSEYIEDRNEQGFTLIELLIAIVVVGILTAVAIVGISGLTNSGQTATCQASLDADRTATAAYFANHASYPTTFAQMTGDTPSPELVEQSGVTDAGAKQSGPGASWNITLGAAGALSSDNAVCK